MAPHWGFPRQHRRLLQGDPSWPHELWIETTCAALGSAWWYTYPSEKYESVGMMKFPTEWKKTSSKPPTRDSCQPSMAPKMGISTCGTNISNILSKEQTCQCCTFWVFLHNTKLVGGAITILKNDGVKVNGVGMTSHIWHGKIKNLPNHQPDSIVWITSFGRTFKDIYYLTAVTFDRWYSGQQVPRRCENHGNWHPKKRYSVCFAFCRLLGAFNPSQSYYSCQL